jgi:phosphopantothenoylcysteine decarboxylase/phosphopantothenate--cysteine ligase
MILVGVCGGVAAYKSCELVRLLVRAGRDVQVLQTPTAERFVGPTTFAALSRRPVRTDSAEHLFPHLEASRDVELLCLAPLTATTLARLAHGEASNVLLATALAYRGPVVAAPAMNPRMWAADATRANAEMLRRRGVELVGPATGDTAEGELGVGRMAEPEEIAGAIERRLAVAGQLAGRRVLVTAGGTREPLDAVRYIGNRSSGRMGVAVADAAARRGADVTLLLCAGAVAPETHVNVIAVETAEQLRAATVEHAAASDVVVMAAAVADYRPAAADAGKRTKDGAAWSIELEPTADILAELGAARRAGQLLIGFAAEHGEGAVERARGKLDRKHVDAIVVNDISRSDIGFDVDDNEIVIVTSKQEIPISRRAKRACAEAILDWLATAREPSAAAVRTTQKTAI